MAQVEAQSWRSWVAAWQPHGSRDPSKSFKSMVINSGSIEDYFSVASEDHLSSKHLKLLVAIHPTMGAMMGCRSEPVGWLHVAEVLRPRARASSLEARHYSWQVAHHTPQPTTHWSESVSCCVRVLGIREKQSERRGFDTDRMIFRDDELSRPALKYNHCFEGREANGMKGSW